MVYTMTKNEAAAELGKLGGRARAKALSAERKSEIATKASHATARYKAKVRSAEPHDSEVRP